jgi:hypothetical protein
VAEIALYGALRGVEGPSGSLAACLEQIDGSTVNGVSLQWGEPAREEAWAGSAADSNASDNCQGFIVAARSGRGLWPRGSSGRYHPVAGDFDVGPWGCGLCPASTACEKPRCVTPDRDFS